MEAARWNHSAVALFPGCSESPQARRYATDEEATIGMLFKLCVSFNWDTIRTDQEGLMRFSARLVLITALLLMMATPPGSVIHAAQQAPPQALAQILDQYVARLRQQLGLSEEQVVSLRQILSSNGPSLTELRARAQSQPYSPQLIADIDRQQRAMRDELAAFLNDEQKAKLAGADIRLPIAPPAFVLINVPPRTRPGIADAAPLAAGERLLPMVSPVTKGNSVRLSEDQKILHLLNRATFGPRPGDVERVRQIGIDRFLDRQLHPEAIDDSDLERRLAVLPTIQMTSAELYQFYPPGQVVDQRIKEKNTTPVFGTPRQIVGELVQQKLVRAVSSERQLQEVMTDFWFNHFNIYAQKDAEQWLLTGYERDVIRPRALGKFRDLLLGVARSPAMLYYLDNWLSASPDSKQPRPPNPRRSNPRPDQSDPSKPPAGPDSMVRPPAIGANPGATDDSTLKARADAPQSMAGSSGTQGAAPAPQLPRPPARKPGINENYARELMELHTMGVDSGYTQKDVQEVARCFTGWTVDRPNQGGGFVFRPWMHDSGAKTVLGQGIAPWGGISDGERVIEILSRHPSTARFLSMKLCRRFVADEPPPQLVERVAQVFLRTEGDIREVLRTILTSAEFNSAMAFRSKVKSPLELAVSAIRAVDGDTNGAPALQDWLRRMGQPLYLNPAPTGYSDQSNAWMNTGLFFNRLNFGLAFTRNQIAGTSYDANRLISPQMAAELDEVTGRLTALVVHTEVSPESRRTIRAGFDKLQEGGQSSASVAGAKPEAVPASYNPKLDSGRMRRVAQVLELLFGSSEFQRK